MLLDGHMRMLLILLSSPVIVLTVHAVASRALPKAPTQAVAFKAIILGCVPTGMLIWYFALRPSGGHIGGVTAVIYCLIVYCSLAYTYFHFFNMSETARRIRILYEIYNAGSLPLAKLTSLYKSHDLVNLRLERLVALKQLKIKDGYYSIDRRFIYWGARVIHGWRQVLTLDRDER